jgi:hypothetical protein
MMYLFTAANHNKLILHLLGSTRANNLVSFKRPTNIGLYERVSSPCTSCRVLNWHGDGDGDDDNDDDAY